VRQPDLPPRAASSAPRTTLQLLLLILAIAVAGVIALAVWRQRDRLNDARVSAMLMARGGGPERRFGRFMVADLPEPARRFFGYAINEGARIVCAVRIEMEGELGLGTQREPGYRPMRARQVLAPPHGLVWSVEAGAIAGSDGATPTRSWTRFWLLGLIPVVRGGGADHHRSAFGRVMAEAAIWAPASLLPGPAVRWEPLGEHTARAIVAFAAHVQNVDITVDEQGRPIRVVIRRWSNANPDRVWREQPFGGDLSDFRDVDGYRLPFRVEGGNHIGTDAYFPFFRARVRRIRLAGAA
jgi:hypothetical protein